MEKIFDIVADLDTPVSAYLKLCNFQPRFLLESVERGEHLARYSFIGLGEAVKLRLDHAGLSINGEFLGRPANQQERLDGFRKAVDMAPKLSPAGAELPFSISAACRCSKAGWSWRKLSRFSNTAFTRA